MSKPARTIPVAVLVATALIAVPTGAGAATTIGQLAPETSTNCRGTLDRVQGTVSSGNTYVVPSAGVVTSWSHNAKPLAGQQLTMKVFRPLGGASYLVVGHDGPRGLTGGTVNTFPAKVAVNAGDVVGLNTVNASTILPNACLFDASPGDSHGARSGSLADGESGIFEFFPGTRVNISALLEPDCDQDGFGDETQDQNLSSCAPGTIPPPAPGGPTCKGKPATIVGTNGSDVRTASSGRDVIAGLGGNDTLSGLAGNDLICGGAGKDTLKGGKGKDSLLGQKGKDTLKGGGAKDKCIGGKGNDTASKCEVEKSI